MIRKEEIVYGTTKAEAIEMASHMLNQHGRRHNEHHLYARAIAGYVSDEIQAGVGGGIDELGKLITGNDGTFIMIGDWNAMSAGGDDSLVQFMGEWDIADIQSGKVPRCLYEDGTGQIYVSTTEVAPYEIRIWFSGWVVFLKG